MSLARDFSEFADQVNVELDGLVNGMAEAKEESQKLNELIFDRLGSIAAKLEVVARIETDMATVKRLADIATSVAGELEIGTEVLATRRDLEKLAAGRQDVNLLRGWRADVLGKKLLSAL